MMTKAQRKAFVFTLLLGTFTMSISQSSLSTAYPTLKIRITKILFTKLLIYKISK